jgi:CO/xanthine dehydrogenase Mo-binding subunit
MDHEITRRTFVRGTLVGGASLRVPLFVTACARDRGAPEPRAAEYGITDWIAILPSGEVVLGVSQPEVGQGSYTALPQILADELDADWSRVSVPFVTGKEAYTISFHAAGLHDGCRSRTTCLHDDGLDVKLTAWAAASRSISSVVGRSTVVVMFTPSTEILS